MEGETLADDPLGPIVNDPPYGVDVIAVDQRARHARRFGAAPDIASVPRLIRGELRKSVILAEQQPWKLPRGRAVHRLGTHALTGRPAPEKPHPQPAITVHLPPARRPPHAPLPPPTTTP